MKNGRKPAQRAQKEAARTKRIGQVRRHEVTDVEWEFLDPLIPRSAAKTGRKPKDRRTMLNGMMWILRTGAPWRDLPERYGPWQTVYDYYTSWRDAGVYDRILQALHIRLDRQGNIDWDLWCIDGSNVRAARAAAGADKKVSRDTPTSPPTTVWAARAADSQASSTWLLTAQACR
jgi:transposase